MVKNITGTISIELLMINDLVQYCYCKVMLMYTLGFNRVHAIKTFYCGEDLHMYIDMLVQHSYIGIKCYNKFMSFKDLSE